MSISLEPRNKRFLKNQERNNIGLNGNHLCLVYRLNQDLDIYYQELVDISKKINSDLIFFNIVVDDIQSFNPSVKFPDNFKVWEEKDFDLVCEISDCAIIIEYTGNGASLSSRYLEYGLTLISNDVYGHKLENILLAKNHNTREKLLQAMCKNILEGSSLQQNKKESVLIVCDDNDYNYEYLYECIIELRNRGYLIILATSKKIIPDIFKMCNNVFYIKNNIESNDKSFFIFNHYSHYRQDYEIDIKDEYSKFLLIKNGISISKENGIQICHVINYSTIIYDPNLFNVHSIELLNSDVYLYKDDIHNYFREDIFSTRVDKFIENTKKIKSRSDYDKSIGDNLESKLFNIFVSSCLNISYGDFKSFCFKNIINDIDRNSFLIVYRDKNNSTTDYNTSIYLSKDDYNRYYLFLFTNDNLGTINIFTRSGNYSINNFSNSQYIISIENGILDLPLYIQIPKYNYTKHIDSKTRYAKCEILDSNFVIPIERLRLR